MAITYSCSSPCIMVTKSGSFTKPVCRILMFNKRSREVSVKKSVKLRIRSSFQDQEQVFEDRSKGIICYRDDNGEMICEGYDEGPRFHPKIPRTTYDQRDAEIIDLLQQNWIQILKSGEFHYADTSITLLEDLNWNGFNTLC